MKIEDIIACVNNTLAEERKKLGFEVNLGHFVVHISREKAIGTYKCFKGEVQFYNKKDGQVYDFIKCEYNLECPVDRIEEVKGKVENNLLTMFFKALRFGVGSLSYDNFVNGTYKGWN